MTEVSQHGLVSAHDGCDFHLLQQIIQTVFVADYYFSQVAKTSTAQCDFCTGIGTYDLCVITATALNGFVDGSLAIEDASFT